MADLIKVRPKNSVKYMVEYMENEYGERATNGDWEVADSLKQQVAELQESLNKQKALDASTAETKSDREVNSEDETDEDDEDDYIDDLPEKLINKNKGPRSSVSAEAFGTWNQKGLFQAKVIAKSSDAKSAIMEKLNLAFMFSALDDKEKAIVVDAMEERKAVTNEHIIDEGDQGDCLYVVGQGSLSCTKRLKVGADPTFLKTYQPGEAFGELALLYNAPRAATITANENCLLWKLDRDTFNHIVKDASIRKREKYEEFLNHVPVF